MMSIETKTAAKKVYENPTEYYGKSITNYSANGVEDWKIFYSDGINIYLISDDYVSPYMYSSLISASNGITADIVTPICYANFTEKGSTICYQFPFAEQNEHYDNTGIRKAIVLTRYVNTLKNWIMYERTGEQRFIILPTIGIMDFEYTEDQIRIMLGRNERTSVSLKVSDTYKNIFNIIKQYMLSQNNELKDENLKQEIEILEKLTK